MTVTLSCEVLRDDILALLYDDGELAERSRARDHLAQCVPCRVEYSELKGTRRTLAGWSLPEATAVRPNRSMAFRALPGVLAAAAGLVLGIGVAMAGRSSFLGTSDPRATAPASSSISGGVASAQFVSYDDLQQALSAQEAKHQQEITDLRRSLSLRSESPVSSNFQQTSQASRLSPATIESLLRASEARQERVIEARLARLRSETDLQRQYDMAQIAAGLAYIDSRTGADAARTSELMKNLVRVTAKPQDR